MNDRTDGHETDAGSQPQDEKPRPAAAGGFREAQARWRRWLEEQRYRDQHFREQRGFFPPRPGAGPDRRRD